MIGEMRRHGLPAPDYSASTLDHVIVRLARPGRPDLDRTMRSTGAQWELLAALDEEHPRSIHEIAEATGKSPGALRPVLRELVGRGLVEATAQPQSRNRRYLLAPRAGARP